MHQDAKDRGCSFPNCDVPGYLTEAHHITLWAHCADTHIDNLTLACGPHHKLADHGWTTRTRHNGDTQWIPPPHLYHANRVPSRAAKAATNRRN